MQIKLSLFAHVQLSYLFHHSPLVHRSGAVNTMTSTALTPLVVSSKLSVWLAGIKAWSSLRVWKNQISLRTADEILEVNKVLPYYILLEFRWDLVTLLLQMWVFLFYPKHTLLSVLWAKLLHVVWVYFQSCKSILQMGDVLKGTRWPVNPQSKEEALERF